MGPEPAAEPAQSPGPAVPNEPRSGRTPSWPATTPALFIWTNPEDAEFLSAQEQQWEVNCSLSRGQDHDAEDPSGGQAGLHQTSHCGTLTTVLQLASSSPQDRASGVGHSFLSRVC